MRKIVSALLVLVAVAVAAIACGGGDATDVVQDIPSDTPSLTSTPLPTPGAPGETGASTEPTETEVVVAIEESISEKPSGGVFRRLWSDPPTLDPALTSDTTSAGIVVEVFGGLVTLNPDLQLVPDIAERWSISEDGLVYTFYLRPNAKFHDGKPVTAHDFKWSIDRAAHPDTASPVADTYLNDIVGSEDVFEGRATDISGVRVIDDHTIEFTIDAPKAYFLAKLTYPTGHVLDRENVESGGRNWADTPNGTGPFKLKEYDVGVRIILERNEYYHREPAKLDSIVMNLAGGQSMAMYENDEIDITGVGFFDLDRILDPNEELNSHLIVAPPDFSVSYIGFNTTRPPFDDVNFRKALNYAVDKELIAKEVLSDLVVPAFGPVPPGFPGYNPDLVGLRHDAELAKQFLADSKYADPDTRPRISVIVPGTGGTITLDLEVVLEMWRQVLGVEVEIQQVEWATYLQDLKDLNRRGFEAFAGLGWEADYPDPQDFLDILFHSESSINHGYYANAEVDRILEEARVEQGINERIELYHQAEELIVADAAWLPLWYTGERYVLVKPHIKGYRVTPMIIPKLKDIYIEE